MSERCNVPSPLSDKVRCHLLKGHEGPHADSINWLKWANQESAPIDTSGGSVKHV